MNESRVRPEWLLSGLVSAALPEPPYVEKYRGAQPQSLDTLYDEKTNDAALDALQQRGVNLVYFRFFAGFGLEHEKSAMERARELITRIHARNMKAAALVSFGGVTLETLLLEEPDAHNWLQYTGDGKHAIAPASAGDPPPCPLSGERGNNGHGGAPSVRVRPCYNSENYLRAIERVCSLALDYGADLIHFDEIGYNPEPDTCRCPTCIAAFREFLRAQYGQQDEATRAAGQERFGHNSFTHVRPPAVDDGAAFRGPHDSPHEQEWIRFKIATLSQALERLGSHIRKRSPQSAVGADLFRDEGSAAEVLYGLSPGDHLPLIDVARVTSEIQPETDHSDGKGARDKRAKTKKRHEESTEPSLFGDAQAEPPRALRLEPAHEDAEAVATRVSAATAEFAARAFGVALERLTESGSPRWIFNRLSLGGSAQPGADFYAKIREHIAGAAPIASVALFQATSRIFGSLSECQIERRLQQALLEQRSAFDLLYETQFAWLPEYKCVVLASCESLSDAAVEALSRFVEGGGELIALGPAGVRDSWRRERPSAPLQALARGEAKSRVTLLPADAIDELLSRVRAHQLWNVESPSRAVSMAAYRKENRTLLLVANSGEPLRDVRVWVKAAGQPAHAVVYSESGRADLEVSTDNGTLHTTLPLLGKTALLEFVSQ
ncbi:MAG TPA: alpha-amylase family protein [Planctomycetota bacterium]|nr:alpha-amylase family protein [Planctomycetota bacterium]